MKDFEKTIAELVRTKQRMKTIQIGVKPTIVNAGKVHRKPVFTPDGDFDSVKEAADFYGIKGSAMIHRLRKHDGYGYY